jgi:hypothetical protein
MRKSDALGVVKKSVVTSKKDTFTYYDILTLDRHPLHPLAPLAQGCVLQRLAADAP